MSRILVVDTSAFVSLGVGDVLEQVLEEFDIATTPVVIEELEQTATYDDRHGRAAEAVLAMTDRIEIIDVGTEYETFVSSRIDEGEASCVVAARSVGAVFLITDDFRALPEVQELVDAEVALSPIVLRALVKRDVLTESEALASFERIAEKRDWLEAPIYRYGRRLLE